MGPITLFDKSFLQSLSVNEAVIFDFLFMSNICPILYVETLGDLAKTYKDGKMPEAVVKNLAEKTPEISGNLNAFHQGLLVGDLAGQPIEMEGRPVLARGKPTRSPDGKSGVVFEPTDEQRAFKRWSNGRFLDVEREQASIWREILTSIDLEGFVRDVRIADLPKVENRQAALQLVEATLAVQPGNMEVLFSMLRSMGVPPQYVGIILERWLKNGKLPLPKFAPYASYVFGIDLYFNFLLINRLVSTRASNRIDLAYLYYLPFCSVFVSSDKFHRDHASLFMRDDQRFVWGGDLKEDLAKINAFHSALPEDELKKGLFALMRCPPSCGASLVESLWDQYLPNWRMRKGESDTFLDDPQSEERRKDLLRSIQAQKPITDENGQARMSLNLDEVGSVTIKRMVRKKRGDYWQVPYDIEPTSNNED